MTAFTARRFVVVAILAAVSASAAPAAFASGGGGGGETSSGNCSTISVWNLQAKQSGQSIEIRAEVFTSLDSAWKWKLLHNGQRFARGNAIAAQERHDQAFFEVARRTTDQPGSDTIRFVATQTVTGEVCDGSVTI